MEGTKESVVNMSILTKALRGSRTCEGAGREREEQAHSRTHANAPASPPTHRQVDADVLNGREGEVTQRRDGSQRRRGARRGRLWRWRQARLKCRGGRLALELLWWLLLLLLLRRRNG